MKFVFKKKCFKKWSKMDLQLFNFSNVQFFYFIDYF